MKRIMPWILLAALACGLPAAGQTPSDILNKVDQATSGSLAPKDMESLMTMTIKAAGGSEKRRELRVWSKTVPGRDAWRVMKFLAPADVKAVAFLVLDDDQMYLYLPEFRRIRRIASHNKGESFMGSDFSYEDMGTGGFSKSYEPALQSEDAQAWKLILTRKAAADKPYSKIVMTVSKESFWPTRMELFDNAGAVVKAADQEIGRNGSYWVLNKIRMKNLKANSTTELALSGIKTDQGLADEIFTQRFLQRRVE